MSIAKLLLSSRAIDRLEETVLYPKKQIAYQFSARGHELAQLLLADRLTNPLDAATVYYRSRPFLLSLGMNAVEAFAGPLGKQASMTQGRDIGVVFNLPSRGKARVLPMTGDIGGQYTPAAGWAEALRYRFEVLAERNAEHAIAVALGGEGSVATSGFWSALNIATTNQFPVLFFIEDNGYAISVPSSKQIPGGDIIANLASFQSLKRLSGDGTDPEEASRLVGEAVDTVREQRVPVLLRLKVPRIAGHSIQDNQLYKHQSEIADELARDPLPKLREFLVPRICSEEAWSKLESDVESDIAEALETALALPNPDPRLIFDHRSSPPQRRAADGSPESGGGSAKETSGARITMGEAIRKTLGAELKANPAVLVFGEDVGAKGGVHAVTLGLQAQFGERRVFDTSLSEEGIIGRAVGMAFSGLRPVAEIQFRKYLDPATEQLHNCGTVRWRTAGAFAAPIVVRVAGGFSRRAGDPWHSMSGEADFVRSVGWHVYIPSNVPDAVGLLRAAIRGNDPVLFFEHRALLDAPSARGIYPGDHYIVEPGQAALLQPGDSLTVVTWGGMVERCLSAAAEFIGQVEIIDLRCVAPWDKQAVLSSVRKSHRLLVVHEDGITAGFGAEIVAVVADEAFASLEAPIRRVATADIPVPYHPVLMEAVLPSVETIKAEIVKLLEF